jgi:hypothetical protein
LATSQVKVRGRDEKFKASENILTAGPQWIPWIAARTLALSADFFLIPFSLSVG